MSRGARLRAAAWLVVGALGLGMVVVSGYLLTAQEPVAARPIQVEVLAGPSATSVYGVIEIEGRVQAAYVPPDAQVGERVMFFQRVSDGAVFSHRVPGRSRYPGGPSMGGALVGMLGTGLAGMRVTELWRRERALREVPGEVLGDDGGE